MNSQVPDDLQQLVGNSLPERTFEPTNVSLFLYNASIWNAHRIHYDEHYTREVEGHPGVVIDGPLQGDWLTQAALQWLEEVAGGGELVEFSYSNRRAAYLGERLVVGGSVVSIGSVPEEINLDLFVKNQRGEVITPGRAIVRIARGIERPA